MSQVESPRVAKATLSRSTLGWYSLGAAPGGVGLTVGTFLVFYYNQVLGVPGATAGLVIDSAGIVPDMQPGDASERTIVALGLGQGGTSLVLFLISLIFLRSYDLGRERHEGVLRRLARRGPSGSDPSP